MKLRSGIQKLKVLRSLAAIAVILSFITPLLAGAVSSTALAPDALSAKALLEDLLARRFTQTLATKIDKTTFSISAELDLQAVPKKAPNPLVPPTSGEMEPISDLALGMLDPEALLKSYSPPGEERQVAMAFLEGFKIKTVSVNVGLSESLAPEVKAEVETWLKDRLNSEFGKVGKGLVTVIKMPLPKAKEIAPPKTTWDMLSQFQSLAGQLALAAAIILGVLLWGILTPRKSTVAGGAETANNASTTQTANSPATAPAAMGLSEEEKQRLQDEKLSRDRAAATVEVESLKVRVLDVLPKVSEHLEAILRSWCQTGDVGWAKVAVLSEVVGKELGKLPIPVDAVSDVTRAFTKMSGVDITVKRDALQKSYWDLLTVMNLGPAALEQPFGYLGGFNIGMVSQVLMEQNPKMRTVVSLFMPPELRAKFMSTMSLDAKRELLVAAAGMSEIPTKELSQLDRGLMARFKPQGREDVIPLEMTLNKLVEALTPAEELVLLAGMQGPAAEEFRRTTPSLAFISEWQDEPLAILLSQATTDEILVLCRVRPDVKERVLNLAPKMTVAMVADEFEKPDRLSAKDKGIWIEALTKRLRTLVLSKALVLEEIFPAAKGDDSLEAGGNANVGKKAA
jgi:flagellar motor switch protein FliG